MKYSSEHVKALEETRIAFIIYMIYMVSFFIRLPARISILGIIRFDLILVATIFALTLMVRSGDNTELKISKYLKFLLMYSILVLPLVSWPGSVLNTGIPNFVKAIIFFFFTYKLVINEERLKLVVYIFIFCNTFRILEPLYLNVTQGYWGSFTSFGWNQVNRLSGAPSDTINANGLAFVIASVLPFYHYLFGTQGFLKKIVYWSMLPLLLYTMSLTLSRSGLLAIVIIYGVVFLKSKKKSLFVILGFIGTLGFIASLNDFQKDRYLSLISDDTESSASADGRISGLRRDFIVGLHKPIFGHGLGTSREANWNIGRNDQPAHNLWVETFQELGFIGFIIFILYVKEIYKGFQNTNRSIMQNKEASTFLQCCLPAMQVWLAMNFLFSFASYGLSSYEWYLFGGFSAILTKLSLNRNAENEVSTRMSNP